MILLACGPKSESHKRSLRTEFDEESQQIASFSQGHIDSVLAYFPRIKFKDLPEPHRSVMFPDDKFTADMRGKNFLEVRGMSVFLKVVGRYRVESFLPEDQFMEANLIWLSGERTGTPPAQYWLVEPQMLYKFAEMVQTLNAEGYDGNAIHVAHGYRYPSYNAEIGGSARSRHVWGDAVDLDVGDVDQNGTAEYADKMIVYDLLNKKLIRQTGGLGRYPHSEHRVHFDLRGYGARWDSY